MHEDSVDAKGLEMTLSDPQRVFLRSHRLGHLATVDPRGQPDVVAVEYQLAGDQVVVGAVAGAPDLASSLPFRNALRSGRIALVVDDLGDPASRGVTVHGRALVDEHRDPPMVVLDPDWVRAWGFPEEDV